MDEKELISRIKRLPLEQPPDDLTDRVMKRIGNRRPGIFACVWAAVNRPFSLTFRPAYAMGAAFLVIGSFFLGRGSIDVATDSNDRMPSRALVDQETSIKNAEAAYLVGRGLLADDRDHQALAMLQRAANLKPDNPEYAYWEGIGFWANGDLEQEQQSYMRGLAVDPANVPLLINLGHSLLAERKYQQALSAYQQVLSHDPENSVAWYNSGLIYRKMNRIGEELKCWKKYLEKNRTGTQAYRALERLNGYGDYSFRAYLIGVRKLILSPERLLDESLPRAERLDELAPLARIIKQNKGINLEVITFSVGDLAAAREKAQEIRETVIDLCGRDVGERIALSWFDSPEQVEGQNHKSIKIPESLLLFSSFKNNGGEEISI